MRTIVCMLVLAACQSSAQPDECDRVVDHVIAVKRSVNKIPTPESQWDDWRRQMAPYCRKNFTPADRTCLLAIKTMEDLGTCMAKVKPDVKDTPPPRTPGP